MDPTVTGALIGAGGAVIVAVAGFAANAWNTRSTNAVSQRAIAVSQSAVETARQTVELTEQGQVTDRYAKAVEQLGSDKLDVRIGGIYALERVANDSPRDHPTIMEVLAAFVREHSRERWPPYAGGAEPSERTTLPDVEAAVTVIGRRTVRYDIRPINLDSAALIKADLRRANLTGAHLHGATLTSATLRGANLTDATLRDADLTRTDLTEAGLKHADLTGADLTGADLTGADLTDADLTGARWPRETAVPEGWQRDTDSGRLKRADLNSGGAPTDPAPAT